MEYSLEVTFVEIYNEKIRDLLRSDAPDDADGPPPEYSIKFTKYGHAEITEVVRVKVDPDDSEAIDDIMAIAARQRATAATDMNAVSSRSHSIFTLHLYATNTETNAVLRGQLNLCDLAGSERLARSKAVGQRQKEARAINLSLSALSEVFLAISKNNAHVPFQIGRAHV